MRPPRPAALRLVTRAREARAPAPPLGLSAWSADAPALAVLLDAKEAVIGEPAAVAAQIPYATELPPDTLVFVLATAARGSGLMRWIGLRTIHVSLVARCTALVARGYTRIGAGHDDPTGSDIAWGFSSPC
jgi:hypothetical protein